MTTRLQLTFFLVLVLCYSTLAQSVYEFKSGLAVSNCHRYGREAIISDYLVHQMATGTLEKPRPGGVLFTNDENIAVSWKKVEVDSTGKFRGDAFVNGYIYVTYDAPRGGPALLNITGNSMCYVNGEPRGGDIYSDGWMDIPVVLKKGLNEIMIRCTNFSRWQGVKARLSFPSKPIQIQTEDVTLPHIVVGESHGALSGGLVVINNSDKVLNGFAIEAKLNGEVSSTVVPEIAPRSLRKIAFTFTGENVTAKGEYPCIVQLKQNGRMVDEKSLTVSAVNADEHHSYTFLSGIDGSVQYYSVAPGKHNGGKQQALFLSVHGAGVQAIGQARAYQPKDWGILVAPTNRRPRGFNWEDWGRIDALEVLALATKQFQPNPEKIYLTGHSMGGHGTWYLGATYPDKWAAIAPCAGYPTLSGYGSADGRIPDSARSGMEQMLLRASNASNVIELARNYSHHGVYIFHGDADRTVPVTFARQMRHVLGKFHPDFSYYEYPGGSHWFGNESVDWQPLFDYFRWHTLKPDSAVDNIHFTTANPGVSASFRWASIQQQQQPLIFSEINLSRDKKRNIITGSTKNVAMLKIDMSVFKKGTNVSVTLDSIVFDHVVSDDRDLYFERTPDGWTMNPKIQSTHKNPLRSGTLKEAFNHRMVFVYGTSGNSDEDKWAFNKARYDAEVWYYRANGAVEVIPDTSFDPKKYPDRGIVLYGNAESNSAWTKLLASCPIQVRRGQINIGSETIRGNDLAALFIWPRQDSNLASIAVISGTGLPGLLAADANQYFAAGSGFPDYTIFSLEMLKSGAKGVRKAGFFDNAWRLSEE